VAATLDKGFDLRSKARESLRTEIAEVAFRVFAERGFDEVTATEAAASSRWAASDGADDLIELVDEAFTVIADPFPRLGD
jgi:hypothetical protein